MYGGVTQTPPNSNERADQIRSCVLWTHIHTYIHTSIYIHIYTYVDIYIYIYIYIHKYAHRFINTQTHLYLVLHIHR